MPPATKKDCGIILFDVASSKKHELLSELIKFATFKYFLNTKSLYRLILVNSAETSNPKKYPGIFISKIEDLDPKAIVELIENAETAQSDWLNAVSLGIHFLKEGLQMPGLITLQLIYFTTLDSSNGSSLNEEKIAQIISQLNEDEMYFYLIGPNVQFPFIINNNSVSKCMKQLQIDEMNENLVVAKKIVSEVNTAVMCNSTLGIHFIVTFKKHQGTQPCRVPIAIGTKLSIPVSTSKIYRKDISLSLQLDTKKIFDKTLADNRDVKIEESDLIKGIVLHNKCIQIEDDMFKMDTKRCFDIIGFTSKKFIPEPYIGCNETYYILPELSDSDYHLFTHLVNVLQETNKYGIIKRVYACNNNPKYYVLIPNVDHNPKCLTMTGLPFGENLVPHKYNSPVNKKLEDDDFCAFFNSLIIDDTNFDHRIPLSPTMMIGFYQQKFINATAKKYLERDLHFENLDSDSYCLEPEKLEDFKQLWPERFED
ncbi:uncharacterized protein LOC130898556 [Diorhabda carinulata]|uniref:uncharacterized protein LOC130898556 n=1 Tax=Diorhabda carinulata TaxID=1163345 RepID=UPI0025A19136|nr:uncharacterized protein LOC130898556 [Diorhabda carinulata]